MQPKIGVIGAGNWGRNVVAAFHALGALAAIGEANTGMHQALTEQYPGIDLYADYRELLASPCAAVAIATPAPSHYGIARDALLAGKDVLVEKPITLRTEEAEELVALARERGRILMVGHLLLFQPAVQWLKAYVQSGALGQLHSLHQERLNLGKARAVENALWSLGVHDVAVLLYLMGEAPCQVVANDQAILQPATADDVYLHLRFPSGARGHLHTSWLWPEKRRRLTVIGSDGMLVYDELQKSVTLHRKGITPDLANRDEGSEVLFQGGGEPLTLEALHFLEAVGSRKRSPLIDGAHGVQVIRVLEEATEHAGSTAGPEPTAP